MLYPSLNGTYIIGDLHQATERVTRILKEHKPARIIWLGDYFDWWGDNDQDAERMAKQLKGLLQERPNDIFLLGNHDISYMLFSKGGDGNRYDCFRDYGWTYKKASAIRKHITRELWTRFKIYHVEDNIVFSHAGVYPRITDTDGLRLLANPDVTKLAMGTAHNSEIYTLAQHSSMIWVRWNHLRVQDKFNQVVGHTHYDEPQFTTDGIHWNVNLDCSKNYIGKFEENAFFKINLHNGNKSVIVK